MATKLASLPATFPPARLGRAERAAVAVLLALAALLFAAWQVPPMLDWSRYRVTIASYATARLGRPVGIAGQVRLTLLPRPMLLADRVTLADRGDGISATIGTLRLEVALSSLLIGHVVPTTLALDDPTATLPWPPPRGTAPHLPSRATAAFAAMVNGGTLLVGGLALHDITGSLRTDPDTGAFAAQGNARVAGLPWRFTALLGAPGADGVSAFSLTLDGRSAPRPSAEEPDMQGTGGVFRGSLLADGKMAGTLLLRGPDLSRLGAGPSLPWQVQGALTADGLALGAPSLALRLGDAEGRAEMRLLLSPPASLWLRASLGQLSAGPWMSRLVQDLLQGAHVPFAADIDVGAGALQSNGTLLQSPRLHLVLGPAGTRVAGASIILPGGMRLSGSGTVGQAGLAGDLAMQTTALHAALDWLASGPVGVPASILAQADLHGRFAASLSRLEWSGLTGTLDGSPITGSMAARLGARPALDLALSTPRLPLAHWVWPPGAALALPTMMVPFGHADTAIRLSVEQVDWPGLVLRHALLDAAGTQVGLALRRLALDVPGGHLEALGALGADGAVTNGRLDLAAQDAAALPAAWRIPAGLWHGGFHLALNGAGPAHDLALTLRADLGDLRAEAEGHADAPGRTMAATVTLRHPGAPRLLAALGLPDARAWLSDGSVAVLTHVAFSPGQMRASDFSIKAGALQMGGAFDAALTDEGVRVRGNVDAPTLALPPLDLLATPPSWPWLHGVQAQVDLKAARVLWGLSPVATGASATLNAGGGVALIQDAQADLPQGHAAGALAVDTSQDPPALSVMATLAGAPADAVLPAPPSPPGLALHGGRMDGSTELFGRGTSGAAWLGDAAGALHLDLHGATLAGLDLNAASAALASLAPALRMRLQRALMSGVTGPLDGNIDAVMRNGVATLPDSHLAGPQGGITLSGAIDAARGSVDLRVIAIPIMAASPRLAIGIAGPWSSAIASADLGDVGHNISRVVRGHRRRTGK